MKQIIIIPLIILFSCHLHAQDKVPAYNKSLADSLQADERGMKSYILVILKTGVAKIEDKIVRDSLFKGHFANMDTMAHAGKLISAGPLEKNEQAFRGIFILNVKTIDEARKLISADPTVKAGIFDPLFFEWYGSAALPMYLPYHKMIQKNKM